MSETKNYEPGLAQALVGNAFGKYEADHLADQLYELSKALAIRDAAAQRHGALGGEYGYGQTFQNEVFEMRPYYWGDCGCGYEDRESAWSKENRHRETCYQHALREARRAAGLIYDYSVDYSAQMVAEDRKYKTYDAKRKAETLLYQKLTNRFDLPMEGSAVHCTCDHETLWRQWSAANHHDQKCGIVAPNFRYIPSGLEIRWYKYIGRGMSANLKITAEAFGEISEACVRSLEQPK